MIRIDKSKFLLIVLLFIGFKTEVTSQIIDNKININLGYCFGNFHGEKMTKNGNFIYPALYANYHKFKGIDFSVLFKSNTYIIFGLGFNYINTSDWNYKEYTNYLYSEIKQYSFSPTAQIHNKFTETGFSNRIKVFVEIAPTLGQLMLNLSNPLFNVQSSNNSVSQLMTNKDVFFGIKSNIGFELTVNRIMGIYFKYSYCYNWIKSDLYDDKQFSSTGLNIGLFIRLKNDKRYFY